MEQIRNDIALMNNSVVIVGVGGGYDYGSQGYTHHAIEDISVIRSIPNIEVLVPADSIETKALTRYLASTNKPSYFRLEKSNNLILHRNELGLFPGKINEIISGEHGSLIFSGSIGEIAVQAARELKALGIFVSVASLSFITNIDSNYIKLAAERGPIVIIEEHSLNGGVGSAILEQLNSLALTAKIGIIASTQNNLSEIGDQKFLRHQNGLNVDNIIKKFKALLEFLD